ncbi:MAG: HTH domain-containing protein, partial [Synergistaceae bacterium]|nr:HTH domain-containing protein [Synergistaceae bacterium]
MMLEDHQGEYISGTSIAENVGVSRAFVWKMIKELQQEGHRIEAMNNRGYRLNKRDDVLTDDGIVKYLKIDSKISRVVCLDVVDSTNNYAKKSALEGAPHGTLITANAQTAGRGRHGHTFESPAGTGLYVSLILRPQIEISKFQMITIA